MDGLAVGATCFRATEEAASAACSALAGVTSAGVVTCSDPVVSAGLLTYTLAVDNGATTTTREATQQLQPCDPRDWTFYQPIVGAWFLALVVILCGRMLYTRTFPNGHA